MSDITISPMLAEMRRLSSAASGQISEKSVSDTETKSPNFAELLKQTIDSVNGLSQEAESLKTRFESGEKNINLAQVMVASQKSSVSFQAMLQVRNKLVDAYKDVINMPM